jgi:aminoglycoside phosphotransferase (APT) family kinase protein
MPMTTRLAAPADTRVMQQCLDPMIAEAFRAESPVCAIQWRRFEQATSYDAHVASVRLESGATRQVFVKDFRSTVRPKDAPKQRREREIRVYRDLLDGAELGTARYHGSLLDDSLGRLWLLLEFVDGTPVGYLSDIVTSFTPAAAALGRLHGHFAAQGRALAGCDFLVHHTHEFFRSKIELAAHCVAAIAPERNSDMARLAKRYAPIVDLLVDQPRTLLQGGCRSTNILVHVVSNPARACIIDWEEAAYGAPLYDVAYLLDGVEPPILDPLLDAYRHEALAYGLTLPARRDMKHVIDCFRLHMFMVMLSQSLLKGYTAQAVAKLLAMGGRIADSVCGNGRTAT